MEECDVDFSVRRHRKTLEADDRGDRSGRSQAVEGDSEEAGAGTRKMLVKVVEEAIGQRRREQQRL